MSKHINRNTLTSRPVPVPLPPTQGQTIAEDSVVESRLTNLYCAQEEIDHAVSRLEAALEKFLLPGPKEQTVGPDRPQEVSSPVVMSLIKRIEQAEDIIHRINRLNERVVR